MYNKTKIYCELNIKHSENTKEFTSSPAMILPSDNLAGHYDTYRACNPLAFSQLQQLQAIQSPARLYYFS